MGHLIAPPAVMYSRGAAGIAKRVCTFGLLALAAGVGSNTHAYPAKPLRVLVGLPAGGGADVIARTVSAKMGEIIGQPLVVENRVGGGGRVASEVAARSAPDGYTLVFAGPGSNAIAVSLYEKLGYDPVKDFAPISMVATLPIVLVVNPSIPTKSMAEFVAYAKARPGKLTYASSGSGSTLHLAMELLKMKTGIEVLHVPYKGGVQAIPDLLAGQIQAMFEILPTQLPYLKAGKTRALAVTTSTRSAHLPDVPTMSEAGIADFDMTMWYGLFAPAAVPKPIREQLHAAILKTLNAREIVERLAQQGADAAPTSAEQLARFQKSEIARWAKVIKAAGVVGD